jgi:hypothetical protein
VKQAWLTDLLPVLLADVDDEYKKVGLDSRSLTCAKWSSRSMTAAGAGAAQDDKADQAPDSSSNVVAD